MVRDFKALVRLNDWEGDQKRRVLAVELQKLEILFDLLQRLEDEIVHEQEQAATMPTEGGMTYGAYAATAIARREDYQARIQEQEQVVVSSREELRLAFLEFKKFEISEERRMAKVDDDIARAEQADLDEIGVTEHNRKNC